jgi:hypothetical protein
MCAYDVHHAFVEETTVYRETGKNAVAWLKISIF